MAPLATFTKDPSAILDYSVDWDADNWLGTDTITGTPVWTVPAGITKTTQSNTTTVATAWFSGGTHGTDYDVACKITTAGGRTDERTIRLQVRNR
jgi:hypothetical protein